MSDREKWVKMQHKTFKNWANYWLTKVGGHGPIENLDTDLSDGINLIKLVATLTGGEMPKYKDPARLRVQKISNINMGLKGLADAGIRLTVSAEQITDGDLKMILGLFWMMIQTFQIGSGSAGGGPKGKSAKEQILEWVREFLGPDYPVDLKDFPGCFKDGVIFSYLVHRKDPNLIDLNALNSNSPRENLLRAFNAAEKLGVPQLLDIDDVLAGPDEQSILTYLSTFKSKVNEPLASVVADISAIKTLIEQTQTQQSNERTAKVEGELSELKKQLQDQSSKMEEQTLQQMKELQEELKSCKKEMKELEAANLQQKAEISDLSRKLEAEIKFKAQIQEDRNNLESELDKLKKKVKDEARSKAMAGGETAMLEQEIEELKDQLEEQKKKKKNYKKLHAEDLGELDRKAKTLKGLEQDKIKLDLDLQEAKRTEAQNAKDRDKLKNQLQETVQKLRDAERERDALQDSRPVSGGGLADKIKAQKLEGELADLKKKFDHKDEKAKARKAKIRELEASMEELKRQAKQNAGAEDEIEKLKAEIDRLQAELKKEKDKNQKLQADLDKERHARAAADEEIERLKLELETRDEERKKAARQIQELEAKMEIVSTEPYTVSVSDHEDQKRKFEEELERLKHSLKDSDQEKKNLRDEVDELQKRAEHEKEQAEKAKHHNHNLEDEVKKLREQLDAGVGADEILKSLRGDNDNLKQENESLKAENTRLNDEVESLKEENDKLNKENDKLNDKNKGLVDEIKELKDVNDELLETIARLESEPKGSSKNIDLELLVRELYYRKGARVSYHHLRDLYEDDRIIEDFCFDAREKLDIMIKEDKLALKDVDSPNRPAEDELQTTIDELIVWKKELRQLQNDWVITTNQAGEIYEPKTRIEVEMEEWRHKLVRIADNPKVLEEEEKNLPNLIDEVKKLLEEDDRNKDEIQSGRPHKRETRTEVEEQLLRVGDVIFENLKNEIDRLKGINDRNAEGDDDSQLGGDTSSVVELMIENYHSLFKGLTSSPKNKEIHQLVSHSISYLKSRGQDVPDLLLKEEYKPYAVLQIKSYAYRGFTVDLKPVRDPYVIAALLKDYFKELREPLLTYKHYHDFVEISELPENKNTLKRLGDLIKDLPVMRRATLTVLIGYLHTYSKSNVEGSSPSELSKVFGPLLLKAPPKRHVK